MKLKSAIALAITLVMILAVSLLALNGIQIGKYIFKPVGRAIKLGLDLRGGVYAVYQAQDTGVEDFDTRMQGTMEVLRNRLDSKGFTEATITLQGSDRIRIEIPDVSDPNEIIEIIGTPAKLEFVDPNGNVILTGEDVLSAEPLIYDGGEPVVSFKLNEAGTQAFAKATAQFLKQIISIQLDGQDISTPTVNSVITGGSGIIEGMGDVDEARNLAMLIQSGALPLDIEEIEVRAISATLGVEALDRSLLAGVIGVIIVMVFMIGLYRLPGLMASMALAIYILIVFYMLANFPGIQLTLPGIAGIILSIGMAVDANVIIFERFKEEMRLEKSMRASLEGGFKNALSAIIDSNVTTIIAAMVLMFFGTGPIKGFAYTLLIGVITSMISAIFITRFLMRKLVNLGIKNRKLFTY